MTRVGLRPRLSPRRTTPAARPRPAPPAIGARAARDTTPLYWALPVLAAVAGWVTLLPWLLPGSGLALVAAGALTGWWPRPVARALAGAVAVPVTGVVAVLGVDGGLLVATVGQRLLLDGEVTSAGAQLFLLGCWTAGLGAVRLAAAGAAVWVRPGPAALLLAWACAAQPQQRLDAAFLAVTATVLAALSLPQLPRLRRLPALLLIALTVLTGAGAARFLPLPEATGRPAGTDVEHVATTDPLALATGWQAAAPQPAFRVRPGTGPMRWAVLDRYNGMHWDTSACTPATPARPGTGTATTVTANTLPGPWLPVPEGVGAADLGQLCPEPGTLLSGDPAGDYTVWAAAPATAPGPDTDGIVVTAAGRALAATLIGTRPVPPDEEAALERLATVLRQGRLDPAAVPGQERGSLLAVAAGERPGTSAQFAAAFALLAAADDHPARVVVGFDAARGQVTTSDVQIWPEVRVAGQWRRFDPQPGVLTPTDQAHLQPAPAAPGQRQEVRSQTGPADTTPADEPDPAAAPQSPDRTWLLLAPVAAAALTLGAVLLRRRLSARRRPPTERIATAWVRTLRQLTRHDGDRQWQAMTPLQVATAAQAGLPGQARALRELAELVTLAGFSGQSIDDAAAARAGLHARQIGTALRRTRKDRS